MQRMPPDAAGSCVQGVWHEAVIGLPGIVAAPMTGIEGAAVIQRGRPQVDPSTRGRKPGDRGAEFTLLTRSR